MLLTASGFSFFECKEPGCQFRFPTLASTGNNPDCPRCGTHTEWVGHTSSDSSPQKWEYNVTPTIGGLLDNIRSAYNVGSIFRTADGVGIRHLYLCGITPTPKHNGVAKTALGSEETIRWSQHNNALVIGSQLKVQGYELWALENDARALSFFDVPRPISDSGLILVVGNEKAGVDPAVREICHQTVVVPMVGQKSSLNVVVAFGIVSYAIRFGRPRPENRN